MTKKELSDRIAEDTGLTQAQVVDVVQRVFDIILLEVTEGRGVEIRNFGVWEVGVRNARMGRDPHKPEVDIPIPARSVVKFKPGKEMKDAVRKLTPT